MGTESAFYNQEDAKQARYNKDRNFGGYFSRAIATGTPPRGSNGRCPRNGISRRKEDKYFISNLLN